MPSKEPRGLAIQTQRNINVIKRGNAGRRLAQFYLGRLKFDHASRCLQCAGNIYPQIGRGEREVGPGGNFFPERGVGFCRRD